MNLWTEALLVLLAVALVWLSLELVFAEDAPRTQWDKEGYDDDD